MPRIVDVSTETLVSRWLMRKFLDWQSSEGKKKSVTAFGVYCGGIPQSYMSRYLSGVMKPDDENLQKMAAVLGDELYGLLGKPRPDPLVQRLISQLGDLSDDDRDAIEATLDTAANRKSKAETDTRVGQSHPKRKA